MALLLCLVFLLSGASALVFETLWFHQATLALGSSIWASSLVLSGFMAGLALGNALAAGSGDRVGSGVRLYAVLELAIAATGVALVYLLPAVAPALAPRLGGLHDVPWLLNLLRFAIAFAFLLVPSTAMGMTLPLLTRALTAADSNFGRVLGRLYGWNTLGAVLGAVLAEFWLIGSLGIRATAWAAGGFNLVAALSALLLASRFTTPPEREPMPWNLRHGSPWLAAAFVSGFALLALEVVWFRFLSLFIYTQSEAFASMLAVVLAGIALGGLAGSQWLRRDPDAHRFASLVAFASGALTIACYAGFELALGDTAVPVGSTDAVVFQLAIPLMLPVSFGSGVFFTLVGAGLRDDLPSEISTAGALTFTNTIGAALGSLTGGFVLLPFLGMERSFFLIALAYGGAGALLAVREPVKRLAAIGAAVFLLSAALFPFGSMESIYFPRPVSSWKPASFDQVEIREGQIETILYVEQRFLGEPHYYRMLTNSFSMSGTGMMGRRFMKFYVYLPVAVHPDPKKALIISFGVGSTAKALTDTASFETIDVVDISRDILEMSEIVFPEPADHPLNDPRVTLHIEDGRYFLETTEERYDLITGDPPPPTVAGVANLYSREYFELVHSRLADGGMATYWLPLGTLSDRGAKAVIGAFCDAFADCSLWNGMGPDLVLVGTRGARGPVSPEVFARQWEDPVVGPELAALGFERPEQLGALFIGGAPYLRELTADTPSLVDDHPKRITAPSSPRQKEVYRGFLDAPGARSRFAQSALIERLWPARIREDTQEWFALQDTINQFAWGQLGSWAGRFRELGDVLSLPSARAPVLWLLGSDEDMQRIIADADPSLMETPSVQFQLAARRLADRDYAGALEALERAQADPALFHRALATRIFLLSYLGDTDAAQELARANYARLGSQGHLAGYWQWLQLSYGIDPRPPNT